MTQVFKYVYATTYVLLLIQIANCNDAPHSNSPKAKVVKARSVQGINENNVKTPIQNINNNFKVINKLKKAGSILGSKLQNLKKEFDTDFEAKKKRRDTNKNGVLSNVAHYYTDPVSVAAKLAYKKVSGNVGKLVTDVKKKYDEITDKSKLNNNDVNRSLSKLADASPIKLGRATTAVIGNRVINVLRSSKSFWNDDDATTKVKSTMNKYYDI